MSCILRHTRATARRPLRDYVLGRYVNVRKLRATHRKVLPVSPVKQHAVKIIRRQRSSVPRCVRFHDDSSSDESDASCGHTGTGLSGRQVDVFCGPPVVSVSTQTEPASVATVASHVNVGLELLEAGTFDYDILVTTPEHRARPVMTIPCHKALVQACSPTLRNTIQENAEENYFNMVVCIPSTHVTALAELIRFMYDRDILKITQLKNVIWLCALLQMPTIHRLLYRSLV